MLINELKTSPSFLPFAIADVCTKEKMLRLFYFLLDCFSSGLLSKTTNVDRFRLGQLLALKRGNPRCFLQLKGALLGEALFPIFTLS